MLAAAPSRKVQPRTGMLRGVMRTGVEETSKVTQLNAASSEEAAAAAEELSAHARTLEGLVSQFRLEARATSARAAPIGTIGMGSVWEESVTVREPEFTGVGTGENSLGS